MKKLIAFAAVAALFLAFGAISASAQGPAGNGAANAVVASSGSASSGGSRSYNPLHWIKKSKSSGNDQIDPSSDRDKKLDANLKSAGLLAQNGNLSDSCSPFTSLHDCLATLHASKNTGIDFNCLRADVTGVQTSADVSACKGASDKRMDLHKAIHLQNPALDAKAQAKSADEQAQNDLKDAQ